MPRSSYIYAATVRGTVLWIGTVKHEMSDFLEGPDRKHDIDMITVHRFPNGSQIGLKTTFQRADIFLSTGGQL